MFLLFHVGDHYYDIDFNGRNLIELHAEHKDAETLCKDVDIMRANASVPDNDKYTWERMQRVCTIYDYDKDAWHSWFEDGDLFERYDMFIIADADEFVDDKMAGMIKSHPNHYWILCANKLPEGLVSPYDVCELRVDWSPNNICRMRNVFTPAVPITYRDLKFNYCDRDYHIDMGTHNVILIRGDAFSCKSLMCDAIWKNTLIYMNNVPELYSDPIYAKVWVVRDNALWWTKESFKNSETYEDVKTFVIDHADIVVDSEFEEFITSHPNHNWVLIGNYKPSCVPDDAVCVLKNEGKRYWTEFVS